MTIEDLGRAARFEETLCLLKSAGYNDDFIRSRFGLAHAEDFETDRARRSPLPQAESPGDVLLALFLAGEYVPAETARHFLGDTGVALLAGMGLLNEPSSAQRLSATVALYPVEEIYIASDRWSHPGGEAFNAPDDLVYPAFVPNTRAFLRHLPEHPGRFLDLCAGTGAGALVAAARGAEEAWSADITARCTAFATFNQRLNGLQQVRPVTSDLYGSLQGRRFDFIAAHPPYVPTLKPKWIFFSGGQDGEEITRRIVAELPDHLEEEGIFLALTMGGDRIAQPFEHRVREWLGPRDGDFDVAVIVLKELDPLDFAHRANRQAVRSAEERDAWGKFFEERRITALVYGFIFVRRRAGTRPVFTVRRQAASGSRAPWEWLLEWEGTRLTERAAAFILDSPLHASRKAEFLIVHHLGDGSWTPASYTLTIDRPFSTSCAADPWMAHMLSLCDGRLTGREILRVLQRNEVLPVSTPQREFASAAASLVSGGFLEVEGFRPPQAAE
jgi:methylase of polypeptide subunit release factors